MSNEADKILYQFFGNDEFPVEWANEEEKTYHFWYDDAHVPHPASPIYASVGNWWQTAEYAFRRFGLPLKDWVGKIVNGYVYSGVIPMEPDAAEKAQAYNDFVMGAYIRNMPKWWETRYEPELVRNLEYLENFDYEGADLAELMILWEDAKDIHERHWRIHWILNLAQVIQFIVFEQIYRGEIPGPNVPGGKDASQEEVYQLLAIYEGDKNSEMLEEMWKLKEQIKANERLKAHFLAPFPDSCQTFLSKAEEIDADFVRAFNQFLKVYGNKAVYAHELVYPSWREDPTSCLETLVDYVETDFDFPAQQQKKKQETLQAIEETLARFTDEEKRKEFEVLLEATRAMAPLTPNHHFYIDQSTHAYLRKVLLAIGERFVREGRANAPDDLVFLSDDEVRLAACAPDRVDVKRLAAERRQLREEQFRKYDPSKYYNIGTVTEQTANDFVKMAYWGWSPKTFQQTEVVSKLEGIAASAGVIEGIAVVVHSPTEFGHVKKGDLLVCDMTNPAWVPLFSKIAGIVTDSGGALAHPAVVAREFGIPAVVGTINATRHIRTGQKIRIDGNVGEVEILE